MTRVAQQSALLEPYLSCFSLVLEGVIWISCICLVVCCCSQYQLFQFCRDSVFFVDYFCFIPLYSVQSILELRTEYSGIIHKEENRSTTDVREFLVMRAREQIIHQTTKQIHELHMTPSRTIGTQLKCVSNRNDF
jgi:hypothetical protein